MRTILIAAVLVAALAAPAAAETVYRWVDDQGRVHFSDEPRQGAEPVELGEPTVYDSQPAPEISRPEDDSEASEQSEGYRDIRIAQPADGATIRGTQQRIQVEVAVVPGLRAGHRLQLTYDGKVVANGRQTSFSVSPVYRGTHTLKATVVDDQGNAIAATSESVFYKHQPSVNR